MIIKADKSFVRNHYHLFSILIFLMGCQRKVHISLPVNGIVSSTPPSISVTLEQSVLETIGTCNFTNTSDPSVTEDIEYKVTFASPIDPATFTASDISNSGTGGGALLTWIIENCGDGTNFKLTASSITGDGTIIPNIPAGRVQDASGETNIISTSVDNSVSYTKNWYQEAYIKALNADIDDEFGYSVAINGDTLVIGVPYEDSIQNTISNGSSASGDNS